jgi:hypothetical protein
MKMSEGLIAINSYIHYYYPHKIGGVNLKNNKNKI